MYDEKKLSALFLGHMLGSCTNALDEITETEMEIEGVSK